MTTQENIAKHLGLNLNEPFKIDKLSHTTLHVDPNLGVVTQDGDRLSNVMLQELFFGNCKITKVEKRKFSIPLRGYQVEDNYLKREILKACAELEKFNEESICYGESILNSAQLIAELNRANLKYMYQFEKYFDLALKETDYFDEVHSLQDVNKAGLTYAIECIIQTQCLTNIVFNMLANYVDHVGLDTVMHDKEIEDIIEDIAVNMYIADTPKDLIKCLEERTKGNGQNSKNSN